MKQLSNQKPFLLLILFTVFILNCKEAVKEAEIEEIEAKVELTDAMFNSLWEKVDALWEQRDPALINTVYADDFIRISPGGTSRSSEELTNELSAVGTAFPGMTLNLVRYDIRGDMVSVHWSVDGNFTGEIAGLKGNGKPYGVKGITVIIVKDGKIVKDDSYWDTYAVFAQAGGYSIVANDLTTE